MSNPNSIITQVTKDEPNQPKQAIIAANTAQPSSVPTVNNSNEPRREKLARWWSKTKQQLIVNLCCWCPNLPTQSEAITVEPAIARVPTRRVPSTPRFEPQQSSDHLLPVLVNDDKPKKTLVLDLDETLVHSSFKPIVNADFVIPVEIEDQIHQVYVLKRPGVDQFLEQMGKKFEVVIFTASLSKYADPVLDLLDIHKVIRSRLFREACCNHKGNYVKDLSKLGRELGKTTIIDNSAASYLFHPQNAIPVTTWFDDMNDTELLDLIPFLLELEKSDDVVAFLDKQQRNSYLRKSTGS